MMPARSRRHGVRRTSGLIIERVPPSLDDRRQARELLFWTIRQALAIVILAAFTIYTVVALATGSVPVLDHVLPLLGR